jgi:4-diphosphocytidyl-2-C-methyl-D-erythritol kinase
VKLETRAPAKLNLCLYVGERRADGLHEICSLFQAVTLADVVTMELATGDRDEVICRGVEGENLAAVALARFRERFGWHRPPVRVTIDKQIPVAAGLGGGSADAGAVLRLATRGSGVAARVEDLQQLAISIGADVPSQVEPGSHLVLGAGEIVERLPKHWHLAALLLTSEEGLSTAHVYEHHDRLGHGHGHGRRRLEHDCGLLQKAVFTSGYNPLEFGSLLANDLEQAALDLHPEAGGAVELLRQAGAQVARLSGSGPTAFGLFESQDQVEAARTAIAPSWTGRTIAVQQAPSDYALVRTSD